MAGFGQQVQDIKEEVKEAQKKASDQATAQAAVVADNPFAAFEKEQALLVNAKQKKYQFIGVWGEDGTGKSGIILDAFRNDKKKVEGSVLHSIDFDMGVGMLSSALHPQENIISWNPWAMSHNDRTAYNYPDTHQRVMNLMKHFYNQVQQGVPIWGVIISGVDSWLEICTNNMRIVDLGLASDAIQAADGAGTAKVDKQSTWAIRNTRFHQLTSLSRDLVRMGVRVFWETHVTTRDFYGPNKRYVADWEKRTNNYLPTILKTEKEEVFDADGELIETVYYAVFDKCKTNPNLQDQRRKIFVTRPDGEPEWYGLPELYQGEL